MSWLTIIMSLISFIITKVKTGSTSKALAVGALTGLGTYYVTHETDWGKANLGSLDGVTDGAAAGSVPVAKDANGTPIVSSTTGNPTVLGTTADVLKSWGGAGTAAVVGTAAVASSSNLQKYLPWLVAGGVILLIAR